MPLYEYLCESCGAVFELRQKFSDEELKLHESCGGPVHRLLSAPALVFKGSGWYVTDYAKQGSSPGSNGDSKGEPAKKKSETDSSKSEGKAETKAEAGSSKDRK